MISVQSTSAPAQAISRHRLVGQNDGERAKNLRNAKPKHYLISTRASVSKNTFHHKCTFAFCPGLPVLWFVDFVEASQDPRHLFKGTRTESKIFKVAIDESSNILTTCLALVQLGSRETVFMLGMCIPDHPL